MSENKEIKAIEILLIFIFVFFIGFILWYLLGGPERWENKSGKNNLEIINKVNIIK